MKRKFFRIPRVASLAIVSYFVLSYAVAMFFTDIELPQHLRGSAHPDYTIKAFRNVPKSWTYRNLVEPPTLIFGSKNHPTARSLSGEKGPSPVPQSGQWQFSVVQVKKNWPFYLPYFAYTSETMLYRIGTRWDDVDHFYVIFSVARHPRDTEEELAGDFK